MIFQKYIDNKTKYNTSLYVENEKLRLFYSYLGFPIVLIFPNYFYEIRKQSFYNRRIIELEDLIKLYKKHDIPINETITEDLKICNRYLKLKKLKAKQK